VSGDPREVYATAAVLEHFHLGGSLAPTRE
jgi:hypothetical protein